MNRPHLKQATRHPAGACYTACRYPPGSRHGRAQPMPITEADLIALYNDLDVRKPLDDPEHNPRYVPRLADMRGGDPVERLYQHIKLSNSSSASLLTGFRGNGKTTELFRLKARLERDGAHVIYVDLDNYVHDAQPLDMTELLLALIAALSEQLRQHHALEALSTTYWDRLVRFLNSTITFSEMRLSTDFLGSGAKFGVKLSQEPEFKTLIRQRLTNHISSLHQQANDFITEAVSQLRQRSGNPNLKVVILVDSLEHIRSPANDTQSVHQSIIETFSTHGDRLYFGAAHMVYTVPPILALYANSTGLLVMWPNIHVRDYGDDTTRNDKGLALMRQVLDKRFARWPELIPPPLLDEIAWHSGGDLRDFFRMLQELLVRADMSDDTIPPFKPETVQHTLAAFRNQLRLTLTEDLRARMAIIRHNKQLSVLDDSDYSPTLRLLDANLVMNYQNGEPWFDIHPLLLNDVSPMN